MITTTVRTEIPYAVTTTSCWYSRWTAALATESSLKKRTRVTHTHSHTARARAGRANTPLYHSFQIQDLVEFSHLDQSPVPYCRTVVRSACQGIVVRARHNNFWPSHLPYTRQCEAGDGVAMQASTQAHQGGHSKGRKQSVDKQRTPITRHAATATRNPPNIMVTPGRRKLSMSTACVTVSSTVEAKPPAPVGAASWMSMSTSPPLKPRRRGMAAFPGPQAPHSVEKLPPRVVGYLPRRNPRAASRVWSQHDKPTCCASPTRAQHLPRVRVCVRVAK